VHCALRLFLPPYPLFTVVLAALCRALVVRCPRAVRPYWCVRGPCAVRFVPTALVQCTYTWPWRML